MLSIDTILAFALVSFLLSITPGPSILYIMARSMSQGPKAGIAAAGGMAAGSLLYVVATVLGIAAIFVYSPFAYFLVKVIGAVYLVYLGYQYFNADALELEQKQALQAMSTTKILKQSLVVELTNPKTALFFIAFLPQFVDAQAGSVAAQLLVLGIIYTLVTLACDTSIALLSGKLGVWLSQHPRAVYWQDRIAGGVLVGLGAFIFYDVLLEPDLT